MPPGFILCGPDAFGIIEAIIENASPGFHHPPGVTFMAVSPCAIEDNPIFIVFPAVVQETA
jgi:hypothetical protein